MIYFLREIMTRALRERLHIIMTDTSFEHISAKDFARMSDAYAPGELINGQIVPRPKPNALHQSAVLAAAAYLRAYAHRGVTLLGPQELYLSDDSVLLPDAFWVSKVSEKCRLRGERWVGAPDVVIEVLAANSSKHDRGVKFDLYEKCGVREYWLIDPADQYTEVHRLERGQFIRQGLFTAGQSFRSTPLGLQVPVSDILA